MKTYIIYANILFIILDVLVPYIYFEGVCLNSRHPDPRRVWKWGSEQQSMTPDWLRAGAAPGAGAAGAAPGAGGVFQSRVSFEAVFNGVVFG